MKKILGSVFSVFLSTTLIVSPMVPVKKVSADPVMIANSVYYGAVGILSFGLGLRVLDTLKTPIMNYRSAKYQGNSLVGAENSDLIEVNKTPTNKSDEAILSVLDIEQGPDLDKESMQALLSSLLQGNLDQYQLMGAKDSVLQGVQQLVSINSHSCKNWTQGGKIVISKGVCFGKDARSDIQFGQNKFSNSLMVSDSLLLALSEDQETSRELKIFRQLQDKDSKKANKIDPEIIFNLESMLLISGLLNKLGIVYENIKANNNPVLERQYKAVIDYLQNVVRVGMFFTAARAQVLRLNKRALATVSDNFWVATASPYLKSKKGVEVLDRLLEKISTQKIKVQEKRPKSKHGLVARVLGHSVRHGFTSVIWGGSVAILAMATGNVEFIENIVKPSLELIYGSQNVSSAQALLGPLVEIFTPFQQVVEGNVSAEDIKTSSLVGTEEYLRNLENASYGVYAGFTIKGFLNITEYLTQNWFVPNGKKQVSKIISKLQSSRDSYYKKMSASAKNAKKALSSCGKILARNKISDL